MKIIFRNIMTWSINILFYLCMTVLIWLFCQVFLFSSFKIPSNSMAPEIIEGDNVLVIKPILGARIFDLFSVSRGEIPLIHRIPGFNSIKRNDILVFNFPYPENKDKIKLNMRSYYIKRCVGIPGDSLKIVSGYYKIEGVSIPLGNIASQQRVNSRKNDSFNEKNFYAFPKDSFLDWNIKDFGPLYIPRKGDILPMDRKNYTLYKKLIEWEQQKELVWQDSVAILMTKPITSYRFLKNYYFMAGDFVEDSEDSRFWGLLPEEYIVGKTCIIWKSVDTYTGVFRWDRFMKQIN